MNDAEHGKSKRYNFSLVLYIFAGGVLTIGIVLLISLLSISAQVMNYELFFQLAGMEQLAQVVLRPLQAGLINTGIVLFALMLVIAALLFSVGRQASQQARLIERVRILEERIEMAQVRN